MTAGQLHTHARAWLEYEGLMHLLPDPHTHAQIRGCVSTYCAGGCKAFMQAVTEQFDPLGDAAAPRAETTRPVRTQPVSEPPRLLPVAEPAPTRERTSTSRRLYRRQFSLVAPVSNEMALWACEA